MFDTNDRLLYKNSDLQTCERQKLAALNDSRNVMLSATYIGVLLFNYLNEVFEASVVNSEQKLL